MREKTSADVLGEAKLISHITGIDYIRATLNNDLAEIFQIGVMIADIIEKGDISFAKADWVLDAALLHLGGRYGNKPEDIERIRNAYALVERAVSLGGCEKAYLKDVITMALFHMSYFQHEEKDMKEQNPVFADRLDLYVRFGRLAATQGFEEVADDAAVTLERGRYLLDCFGYKDDARKLHAAIREIAQTPRLRGKIIRNFELFRPLKRESMVDALLPRPKFCPQSALWEHLKSPSPSA